MIWMFYKIEQNMNVDKIYKFKWKWMRKVIKNEKFDF